ncbi:MAG TPA: hypothetical protein G4N98_00420 [Thermoflexia bacterium]|nr:hypothetical protein [Thermoflexia bacterium]
MELSQIEQMVRFLDEERKRDKSLISQLQERTEQQRLTLDARAGRVEELQQQIDFVTNDLRRTDSYPGMIDKARRELTSTLETLKDKVNRQKLENERLRRSEIETLLQDISDLDKRLRILPRYDEALQARAEGERKLQARIQIIGNELRDLTTSTDDRLQSITYLEEQRRADARQLVSLAGELPPLRIKLTELTAKNVRLEDNVRKLPGRVEEAINIARSYDPRIEELRIADFKREQLLKKFTEQAAEMEKTVTRIVEKTQQYSLLSNQIKRDLGELEPFRIRIERRQGEISEMQRLTEERMKRQWEEWQTIFTKDWQKRQVTEADHWRRQDLANQKSVTELAELDKRNDMLYAEILALWEELRDTVERWRTPIEEVLTENQVVSTEHLKLLRNFEDERRRKLL